MHEESLVNLQLLVSKVEKLREAQPYLQFIARFQTDLHSLKRPIVQAVRQSVRQLSQQIQRHTFQDIKEFAIRKPNMESNSQSEESYQPPVRLTPEQDAYKQCFENYIKEKQEREHMKLQEQLRQQAQMRKLKEVNDRIDSLEREYAPIEWQHKSAQEFRFEQASEMIDSYLRLFDTQLKRKQSPSDSGIPSLMLDEYEMRNRIFEQLSREEIGEFVGKATLLKFLKEHHLLMLYFNIDPSMLNVQIKHFDSKDTEVLLRSEFHRFLTMPRTGKKFLQQPNHQQCEPQFVLQQQYIEELHHIYSHLDTYGANMVSKRQLVRYLDGKRRKHHSLLSADAVYFRPIKRCYSIARLLLFEFEPSMVRDNFSWDELIGFISDYYQNEARCTIDVIQQKKVISGQLKGTHIYLVGKQYLSLLKKSFERCEKHCLYFVDKAQFFELVEANAAYSAVADCMVRVESCNGLPSETIAQTIERIKQEAYQYLDLDEIIESFSFGGRTILQQSSANQYLKDTIQPVSGNEESSSSSDRRHRTLKQKKPRANLKNIKSTPNIPNRITLPFEFKLSAAMMSEKQSIRKRRLEEMLQAKQQLEQLELNFKFRAKRVPHYPNVPEQPASKLRKSRSEEINFMPLRLLANPDFWQPKNPEHSKPHCTGNQQQVKIEVKPLPQHCKDRHRLEKIERNNQSRRFAIFEQTKQLYENQTVSPALKRLLEPVRKEQSVGSPEFARIKPTPVPDFKRIHEQAEAAKPHRPKSVNTTKERNLSSNKPQDRTAKFPDAFKNQNQTQTFGAKTRPTSPAGPKQEIKIMTTKKYDCMVEKRQERQNREREMMAIQNQKDRVRELQYQKFYRKMYGSAPKISARQIQEWQTQEKLARFREEEKRQRIRAEQELQEMYKRVLNRPFLCPTKNPSTTTKLKKKNRNEIKPKQYRFKKSAREDESHGLAHKQADTAYKRKYKGDIPNYQSYSSENQVSQQQADSSQRREQHYLIKEPQRGQESGSIHMCDEHNYSL